MQISADLPTTQTALTNAKTSYQPGMGTAIILHLQAAHCTTLKLSREPGPNSEHGHLPALSCANQAP